MGLLFSHITYVLYTITDVSKHYLFSWLFFDFFFAKINYCVFRVYFFHCSFFVCIPFIPLFYVHSFHYSFFRVYFFHYCFFFVCIPFITLFSMCIAFCAGIVEKKRLGSNLNRLCINNIKNKKSLLFLIIWYFFKSSKLQWTNLTLQNQKYLAIHNKLSAHC